MDEPLPTAERNLAVAVSVALVAAVLGPLRQQGRVRPRDGFPLSYYPMFSARRTGQLAVTHLVGVDTCRVSRPLCSSLRLAAWSMHVGIFVTMRITFRHQLSGVALHRGSTSNASRHTACAGRQIASGDDGSVMSRLRRGRRHGPVRDAPRGG